MTDRAAAQRPSWRAASPFVATALAGLATLFLPPFDVERGEPVAAVLLMVPTLTVLHVSLSRPTRTWVDPVAPWLFFGVLALGRDASGGSGSALSVLVVLPILWLCLFGTRRDLWVGALLTAALFVVPVLVVGAPRYPSSDWRPAVLWTAFAVVCAPVIQRLVTELGSKREEARTLAAELEDLFRGARLSSIVATDLDGTITRFSHGAEELLGHRSQDVVGRHTPALFHDPDEVAAVAEELGVEPGFAVFSTLAERGEASRVWTYVRADGERRSVRLVVTALHDDTGEVSGYLGVAIDTTVAVEAQLALARSEAQHRALLDHLPDTTVVVVDEDLRMRVVSGAGAMRQGLERYEGRRLAEFSSPENMRAWNEMVPAALDGREMTADLASSSTGSEHSVVVTPLPPEADGRRALIVARDVGEERARERAVVAAREEHERQLRHLADHDPLTGLANRRRFYAVLGEHLDRCGRHGADGALLLLDLDHFKEVNDLLGHGAGDDLIATTARLLVGGVPDDALVARLGGDEFAVLVPHGDLDAAAALAASVVGLVGHQAQLSDGVRRRVTASVGVVPITGASGSIEDVLSTADMAMYDAKDLGRNTFAVFDPSLHDRPRSQARLRWLDRLERALETDAFVLHLQPIRDLGTGSVGSAEALLRLDDGDGIVYPGAFLDVAERAGLIGRIDQWVIREGIALLARLRETDPGFVLELNLSGHSIGDPAIEQTILEALAEHDVPASALVLEITETAAVADIDRARRFAQRMIALGCKFALDDFGAGYGSFYYLKHLLFDYIKIDGEFMTGCHRNAIDRTILRSVVGIARDLGKRTIAEFVSEPAILQIAIDEGVDFAQGYAIGRPVPVDDFLASLTPST